MLLYLIYFCNFKLVACLCEKNMIPPPKCKIILICFLVANVPEVGAPSKKKRAPLGKIKQSREWFYVCTHVLIFRRP